MKSSEVETRLAQAAEHGIRWAAEDLREEADELRRLRAALRGLLDTACRPGDDGRYDDTFDDARRIARELLEAATAAGGEG